MAIIRGAYGGAQIRNSISGVTFAQGPFGTVARARTPPVNPNSSRQVDVRSSMALVSNRWSNDLTAAERAAWAAYAAATPLPDPFGGTKVVSGRTMYIRTNVTLLDSLGSVIDTAPATPGVASPIDMTLTADTTDGLEIAAFVPAIPAGGIVTIGVGLPVSQARNFYKAPFTQIATANSATTLPLNLIPNTGVAIGQRYYVIARHIDVDAKVSEQIIRFGDVTA